MQRNGMRQLLGLPGKPNSSSPPRRHQTLPQSLTVTLEALHVPVEPGGAGASTLDVVGAVAALAKTTGLASSAGEATALPVLVHRVDDPVDAGVVADLGVRGIDQNNFVVLHGGVLVDPVRVKNAEVAELAPDLLLGDALEVAVELQMVDTLVLGLTEDHTTVVGALASTATDAAAHDDVSLLGLVAEAVGLVSTGGAVDAGDLGALAVLPGADAEEEADGVTLLVTPQLFHILVATHGL